MADQSYSKVVLTIDPGKNVCSVYDAQGHLLTTLEAPSRKVLLFTAPVGTTDCHDWAGLLSLMTGHNNIPVNLTYAFDTDPSRPTSVNATYVQPTPPPPQDRF
jgi:hypothetical protein